MVTLTNQTTSSASVTDVGVSGADLNSLSTENQTIDNQNGTAQTYGVIDTSNFSGAGAGLNNAIFGPYISGWPGGYVVEAYVYLDFFGPIDFSLLAGIYNENAELLASSSVTSYVDATNAFNGISANGWYKVNFSGEYIPRDNIYIGFTLTKDDAETIYISQTPFDSNSAQSVISQLRAFDGTMPMTVNLTSTSSRNAYAYLNYYNSPHFNNFTSKASTWTQVATTWAGTTETWGDLVDYTQLTNL